RHQELLALTSIRRTYTSGRSAREIRRQCTYAWDSTSWVRSSARCSSPVSSRASRTRAGPRLPTYSSKVTSCRRGRGPPALTGSAVRVVAEAAAGLAAQVAGGDQV